MMNVPDEKILGFRSFTLEYTQISGLFLRKAYKRLWGN